MTTAEFIQVRGAHENNLRGISVDIPKRQLTVFTGVSGSGKSSLVFDTIAAESQRLVNETYPGFVQGFMQSPPRPDVEQLSGLTAAIVVGQEPLAPNSRSTFGTAADITGGLRILFSRLAEPSAGGPAAYSFNVPSASGQGAIEVNGTKEVRRFSRTGGMCPRCEGTGQVSDIDTHQLLDYSLSLNDGAIIYPGMKVDSWMWKAYAESGLYPADVPIQDFTDDQLHDLLYLDDVKVKVNGINASYQGLVARLRNNVLSRPIESLQKHMQAFVGRAVVFIDCPDCGGTRLAQHARESYLNGASIADVCDMELVDVATWLSGINHPAAAHLAASVNNAIEVGLGYLSLNRPAGTLSGGEAQRTRMIRHLGSALSDVTYVFDEPTSGLHPHDIDKMNDLLLRLRDKGNTVLVVEHKPQTIAIADYIVDIGPGAGPHGGEVVFAGPASDFADADTLTSRHLHDRVALNTTSRSATGTLPIRDARANNLRGIDVDVPSGVLSAITGVAGSGKSSLLSCLPDDVADRVLIVDQSTIRGSRRSNPATYTGAFDSIRKTFAKANDVKPALFSANSEGACPNCNGAGSVHVDLGALSGVDVTCEVCEGRRFSAEVLTYTLGDLNIADLLDLPAEQAGTFCRENRINPAKRICDILVSVGLGYLPLGQALNTLSGGERQRLKLAVHMAEKKPSADILVLDEPTTGLHLADIDKLLALLDSLVEGGTTVICVEHHLAVIAHADHIIDLGPGAGSDGGQLVAACTPEELTTHPESVTGHHLAKYASAN